MADEIKPIETNQELAKLKETMLAGMTKLNSKIEALKEDLTPKTNLEFLLNNFHSKELDKINKALSLAQGEFKCIGKSSAAFRGKYANLGAIIMGSKDILSKYELEIDQNLIVDPITNQKYILTVLGHSSGQWKKSLWPINPQERTGNSNQEEGKSVTYWRRYIIQSMINLPIADEDDLDDYNNEEEPKTIQKQQEIKRPNIFQKGNPGIL